MSQAAHPRLAGEVALVTGAARNIGAAIALRLAADGAAVALHYHTGKSHDDAEALAARIRGAGGAAMTVVADLADEAAVAAMAEAVRSALGAPAILVCNAAASVVGARPWNEIAPEEWDHVLRANVTGTILCLRALCPSMQRRGRGRVILTGSVRSPLGLAGNAHYTASKSALEGLGRVLARELGGDGITVNTIVIGAIRTPAEAAYGDPGAVDRRLLECQSVKRRGLPEDVAALAGFLASGEAGFITGQCITVDGGWSMR